MMPRLGLSVLLLAWTGLAAADATVPVCYGYGCIAQAQIRFSEMQLREVGQQLAVAVDPAEERKMMFGMLKELCPKDVRIVSSQIDGEKASLKLVVGDGKPVIVENPVFGKTKEETSGECTMLVENGQWKVDKESWKTKSSSVDSAPPSDVTPKAEKKKP